MSLQVHVAVLPVAGPIKQVPDPPAFLSLSLLPWCPFSCVWLCSALDMEKDPVVFLQVGLKASQPRSDQQQCWDSKAPGG